MVLVISKCLDEYISYFWPCKTKLMRGNKQEMFTDLSQKICVSAVETLLLLTCRGLWFRSLSNTWCDFLIVEFSEFMFFAFSPHKIKTHIPFLTFSFLLSFGGPQLVIFRGSRLKV